MELTSKLPSTSLQSVLHYAKTQAPELTWTGVARALAPHYSRHLTLVDVVEILMGLYEEALTERRFEMGHPATVRRALLLSPIKGNHSVDLFGPQGLDTTYSVEQFYNAFISFWICSLRMARVDWLNERLLAAGSNAAAS